MATCDKCKVLRPDTSGCEAIELCPLHEVAADMLKFIKGLPYSTRKAALVARAGDVRPGTGRY